MGEAVPVKESWEVLAARRPPSGLVVASAWLMLVLGVPGVLWGAFASFLWISYLVDTSPGEDLHRAASFYTAPALASFVLCVATASLAVTTLVRRSQQRYESAHKAWRWAGTCLSIGTLAICCNPALWGLFLASPA